MDYTKTYKQWLERAVADPDLTEELTSINGNSEEIEDRFYRELEFGTGGLRGVIGAGTNRMNIYTVAKATQGYSDYLRENYKSPKVAIAYDSRIKSRLFAETAASVFAANGIRVYIYPKLMPTPALSFAVRYLRCSGGIVVTASHNPSKYNGYKVYNSDGCQITTDSAKSILGFIKTVDAFDGVSFLPFENGLESGLIENISDAVITAYIEAVSRESLLSPDADRNLPIVYTPLNGTGISCVPRCLAENGFTNVRIPDKQREPDGRFPTCPSPNPEIKEALDVGIACALETGSELVLATDPDCDRVGAAVKYADQYALINGNQMGVLLFDFVCRMRIENGTMPENPIAIKTIVTTPMAEKIAEHYGVELVEVLTGFKFIGEQIGFLEQKGQSGRYIFGFEESYGYLSGSFVRDKDAVDAALLICEMFVWYKRRGKTLLDGLKELYEKFGAYSEALMSFAFEGASGFAAMKNIMDTLRNTPTENIGGIDVVSVSDYKESATKFVDGRVIPLSLPKSDVIGFRLTGGSSVVVRPSGTEPKLKIYISASGKTTDESSGTVKILKEACGELVRLSGDGK
jgi:phosphoglucomutase